MPIKKGTTGLSMALGTTIMAKLYKGTTLLYENASWELFSQQYLYYTLIPQTINSKSVKNKAKISKIYGNGVIENQLVTNGNFGDETNDWSVFDGSNTHSVSNNEIWFVATQSITAWQNGGYIYKGGPNTQPSFVAGHKYMATCEVYTENAGQVGFYYGDAYDTYISVSANVWQKLVTFRTQSTTVVGSFQVSPFFAVGMAQGQKHAFRNAMLVDLTLMFGTGNEPTTLTDNRIQNILNRGYIPYNLGEYKGTDIGEFKSEPYNLLSGVEVGTLVSATGEETTSNDTFRTDFISVISGGSYTFENGDFTSPTIHELDLFEYDDNKTFIKRSAVSYNPNSSANKQTSISVGSSTKYIRMTFYSSGTNWNNTPLPSTLCFHLTGTRTGYAEHKTFTPITFKAQLNGFMDSHDTMEITKANVVFTHNRGSYVFTGNETVGSWNNDTNNYGYLISMGSGWNTETISGDSTVPSFAFEYLFNATYGQVYRKEVVNAISQVGNDGGNNNRVVIRSSTITTTTDMKTWLTGKVLRYPLATPQVITIPRKHLGIVDLGSLTWNIGGAITSGLYRYYSEEFTPNMSVGSAQDGYCSKYLTDKGTYNAETTECIRFGQSNNRIYIYLSANYSTSAEVQAALSGIYAYYPTATETTDITDTIDIESGGTITSNLFSWVENQIVYDGNFANGINEWFCQATIYSQTASGNIMTVTKNASGAGLICSKSNSDITYTAGHKFVALAQVKPSRNCSLNFDVSTVQTGQSMTANVWNTLSYFANPSSLTNYYFAIAETTNTLQVNDTVQIKNVMLIDLTQAFGSGNEPTNVNDPRIQYIINKGYIPTNTTGTLKSVATEVLPNVDLSVKCK